MPVPTRQIVVIDPIAAELWEIAENLHRCDLSKEQRDEHIRRYAELLRERVGRTKPDNLSDFTAPGAGRGNKGVATQIAEETGFSKRTVERALNPKPKPPRPQLVEVVDACDAIAAQAAAIVRAWNRACPEIPPQTAAKLKTGPNPKGGGTT